MIKALLEIMKNRAKVGAVNFGLELLIGILSEWQRANREGNLDFNVKKDVQNQVNQKQMSNDIKH